MHTAPQALDRFLAAQAADYALALAELRRGRKQSHWVWYVLPQLRGLGLSAMAQQYGLAGLQEARDYALHPVLGARLRECVAAITAHRGVSAAQILGDIDAMKFRSCLTLFMHAAPQEPLFAQALQQFFGGEPDARTLALLHSG
ncbi:MAG: DUF1810 domain-containing protein [Burkholderiales bacterium]|nr:DUF1810 domain-containing protein [Burkholderiales bacterium]